MFNVNEYFEGKVKSIGFNAPDGKATVGVMAAGDYEFGTDTIELMTLVAGEWDILLPGETEWKSFDVGETFTVEKGQKFKLKVKSDSAYLCEYK
ncbi:pyrimidine/purine nucleoside phosphorylase [Verrucomicrobiota bacterium]